MPFFTKKTLYLLLGPLVFTLLLLTGPPQGMPPAAHMILAATCWMALWWITEAVPIAVTSLLPLILFPLTGGLDMKTTSAAFGSSIIFLYIGGFILAIGIEKWNLHKRIALLIGVHPYSLMVGACIAASCAFMLPVATPPNAVVFGSGLIRMQDMVKTGISLNLFSILAALLFTYFLLPLAWGIDLTVFPDAFR